MMDATYSHVAAVSVLDQGLGQIQSAEVVCLGLQVAQESRGHHDVRSCKQERQPF